MFCLSYCFFPSSRRTKTLDYRCGDLAQLVQILGSARGWRARLERAGLGWASLALGQQSVCKAASWKLFPPSGLTPSQPFPQSWGEQDGTLSLLSCVFPFLDVLPLCLCQYNLSHSSAWELHWFWREAALAVRGRDRDCVSERFTVAGSALSDGTGTFRYHLF